VRSAPRLLPELVEGDGVLLRRWRVEDAEALGRAVDESREHLRPWMEFVAREPKTLDERRAMMRKWEQRWLEGGDVLLGIFVAEQVAGSCGLHRRRGPAALEIGYWVHPAHTRKGLATAVVRLLTDAAFSVAEVMHVEIHTDKANIASSAVPRRLGFRFLGETRDERTAPAEVGIDCGWRMDRADWSGSGR
jgi:ribosomal-protein-serine acetyltransferase